MEFKIDDRVIINNKSYYYEGKVGTVTGIRPCETDKNEALLKILFDDEIFETSLLSIKADHLVDHLNESNPVQEWLNYETI